MKSPDRVPSLDGWRALSIVLVLFSHIGFNPRLSADVRHWLYLMADGDLGVRFFFVISGFLITRLLVEESGRTGRIDLRKFYLRRALRILPVYYVFLVTLHLLTHAGVSPVSLTPGIVLRNYTFTTNFGLSVTGSSGHLWSLAVEEQFYLVWPLLVVGLDLFRRRRAIGLAAIPLVLAPISRVIGYKNLCPGIGGVIFGHYSFFNYFDSIAIGCLCALILSDGKAPEWLSRRMSQGWWPVLGVSLLVVPEVLTKRLALGFVTVPFGYTLQGLGIAALLLQSIYHCDSGFYRLLNAKPVRVLGILSYSIYIWQQPVFLFAAAPGGPTSLVGYLGVIVGIFALAVLSYFSLERPIFSLRSRLRA